MFGSLLPKGAPFFELLLEQNQYLCTASAELVKVLEGKADIDESHKAISLLEEKADAVYISIIRHLSLTFITPIDREDILDINKAQEDSIDIIQNITTRLHIIETPFVRFPMFKLAESLDGMVQVTSSMLEGLSKKKDSHETHEFRALLNECELLINTGTIELYDKPDPTPQDLINILKWSQAYDKLEIAVVKVGRLAEAIEKAVLKNV